MPVIINSDRLIEVMEIVRKLCENHEYNSKQAAPQDQIKCRRDELLKQNKFRMDSAFSLLKTIIDLNDKNDIAMKTIDQLQAQFEKIKEAALTLKGISHFEKTLQLTKLRNEIQRKQIEVATLQKEISNDLDPDDGNMMIGHDDSLDSGMKSFIILCELPANGALVLLLRSL